MKLTIDLESRSPVDLRKTTSWVYAEHPDTQIMCFAFKEDDDTPWIYAPDDVQHMYTIPRDLCEADQGYILDMLDEAEIIDTLAGAETRLATAQKLRAESVKINVNTIASVLFVALFILGAFMLWLLGQAVG